MAKSPKFSTGFRNGLLDGGMLTAFDGGTLEIRDGVQPASADDAPVGTLLASIPLTVDAFAAAASGGSLAKSAAAWEDISADAAGTATWFRMKTSTDTGVLSTTEKRIDGSVATVDADLVLSGVTFAIGDKVVVDTFSVNVLA